MRISGAASSAASGDAPSAAAMRRWISVAWTTDSLEPRAPMRTGGCEVGGKGLAAGRDHAAPATRAARFGQRFRRMKPPFLVLGLETSCDETAAAVVRLREDGRAEVISSVVASQIAAHAPYGGVVPEVAARAHVELVEPVARQALMEGGVMLDDIAGIAATAGPGLVGAVMVGLSFAKGLALARGLPLIAVNHLEGHAISARLEADVAYPFLLLLVSGGHCQLLEVAGVGACTRLGSTIDDAAGEAFDKIAKALGLPYPGGPALERLAEGGDPDRFPLPRALLGRAGCDFSFSGLKTAAARLAEGVTNDAERRDLAAAVQAAIARQLAERSQGAMAAYAAQHGP